MAQTPQGQKVIGQVALADSFQAVTHRSASGQRRSFALHVPNSSFWTSAQIDDLLEGRTAGPMAEIARMLRRNV
jgi:hypothetical protein